MILTGKDEVLAATPVSLPLFFTINLTWNDLGSNPGLRGDFPASDSLSHGTVL
jgi:hypothetical protein